MRRVNTVCGKKYSWYKKSPDGLTIARAHHSPKQWLNYLTNLAHTYNPSTTLWGVNLDRNKSNFAVNSYHYNYIYNLKLT